MYPNLKFLSHMTQIGRVERKRFVLPAYVEASQLRSAHPGSISSLSQTPTLFKNLKFHPFFCK